MHLTQKQLELLRVIGARNPDGEAADLDQILERLSYKPTKQSLQFSIRALIAHDLIQKDASEKRRGRTRTVISLTKAGEIMNGVKREQSFVTEVDDEELMDSLSEVFED